MQVLSRHIKMFHSINSRSRHHQSSLRGAAEIVSNGAVRDERQRNLIHARERMQNQPLNFFSTLHTFLLSLVRPEQNPVTAL